MNRRKLPQAEVSGFIAELQQAGATQIRRIPGDARGLVEVRWDGSDLEQQRQAAEMQAWHLPMILAGLVAAIIIVVLLILL